MHTFSSVPLTSPLTLAALLVLALLGAGVRLLLRPRRRTRRLTRVVSTLALTLAVVASTATAADATNTWFGYLPHLGDAAALVGAPPAWVRVTPADVSHGPSSPRARSGGVLSLTLPDRGSGFGPTHALVWLPPQYFTEPSRRFAVVYLAHGSPGVPADWFRGGQAAEVGSDLAAAGLPLIIVAPRLSHGWLDDPECVDGAREQVLSHILRDVVPGVDAQLRTAPVREARLIGGMSAGGFCALNTGLRHPEVFASVMDLSGFTEPTHRGGMRTLYRPGGLERARADSPGVYASHLAPAPQVHLWLGWGRGESVQSHELPALATTLTRRGFAVRTIIRPGEHTFRLWRPLTEEVLTEAAPALVAAASPRAPLATARSQL